MNQTTQINESRTVSATSARDRLSQPVEVINEADLDQVAGGGGCPGGVLGDAR